MTAQSIYSSDSSTENSSGAINISPNAVAMVAGIAALQCFGVVGMASRSIQDGIAELLNAKENLSKGITVEFEDEQVFVSLYTIVEYGMGIREIAKNVIENVKYAIESQLGLDVAEINVIIQGVRATKK
jgi:uncharacterized alkaline shock family protein YloU